MTDITLFGPSTISSLHTDLNEELKIQLIENIRVAISKDESYKTNVKCLRTNSKIHEEYELFDRFKKIICNLIHNNCRWVNELFREIDNYKTLSMWGMIYNKGDYAITHEHIPSHISYVFYLKVDENSSPLVFDEFNYQITPNEGQLLVFPGHMKHCVPVQKNYGERIAISGNILLDFLTG